MATRREYFLQLVNTRTKKPVDDDTGVYQVYTAGAATRPSIWDATGAVATQEVVGTSFLSQTMTDGQIHFFTNLSVSAVDISVLTAGGRAYFLDNVTPSQHRVDVDPEKEQYILTIPWNDRASCTTVRPLGFRLRKGMKINDICVNVTAAFAGAAAASNRYNVGRSGDANGFLAQITCSSVGFKRAHPDLSTTGVVITSRYGADLGEFHASTTAGVDFYIRKSYIAATATASNNLVVARQTAATLTHSFTNTGVSGAGKGYIYISYELLPGNSANL